MPILMGRKTFDSIGKPLPGRKSIVITRNKDWQHDNVSVVHSVEEAIELAKQDDIKEIFVIGGAEIFNTSFDQADRLYLTRVHQEVEGDVYFPAIDEAKWKLVSAKRFEADEKNAYAHTFQVWERK